MIIKRKFKIPAKVVFERNSDNTIMSKTLTPDIDWENDPIIDTYSEDTIWENNIQYFIVEVSFSDADLQVILDKGWEEL